MQALSSLPRVVKTKSRSLPSTSLRVFDDFVPPFRRKGGTTLGMTNVACWGEVDGALAELAKLARERETLERSLEQAVARIESESERQRQALVMRQRQLEAALERFCRGQGELDRVDGHGRRSRRLLFGRVGYRAAQAVTIRDEAAALRALARWRAGRQFLRVRTEVDRESLRQFLLECAGKNGSGARMRRRLQRAGVKIQKREKWFYEIDGEAVERWSTHYKVSAYAGPPTPRLRRVQAVERWSTQRTQARKAR